MIVLKFNRPENWILLRHFSPVGLFKSLPACTELSCKNSFNLMLYFKNRENKKRKKERVSEKELNFELGSFWVFNPKFFLLLEMYGSANSVPMPGETDTITK